MAVAAAVGALVTAVYTFFTILLWRATKKQAESMNRMLEATHRPYVSIALAWSQPVESTDGAVIVVDLHNHGLVPAVWNYWRCCVSECISFSDHGNQVLVEEEEPPPYSSEIIYPGQTRQRKIWISEREFGPNGRPVDIEVEVKYEGFGGGLSGFKDWNAYSSSASFVSHRQGFTPVGSGLSWSPYPVRMWYEKREKWFKQRGL